MKKLYLFAMALLGALTFVGCDTEDPIGEGNDSSHERIVFTLLNKQEPVVAAPDEEVVYMFKISYSQGIASVHTSLNGVVVEGSEVNYLETPAPALAEGTTDGDATPEEDTTPETNPTGAPTEVEYTFSYEAKGAQFGETLDFVFTATGADGYTQSVDYALWVSANTVEFTVSKPEGLPESIYSDYTLNFDIKVECGNYLKSFEVFKNETLYDSVEENDISYSKTYTYNFTYTPIAEDINKTLSFRFVATDAKNNPAEVTYEVAIVKADAVGKMLWSEIFDTTMIINGTSEYNTTAGGVTTGSLTAFEPTNIAKYNTLYVLSDPENADSEMVANAGAMEGCEVYDKDLSVITYTTDGTNVCLSKYDTSSVKNVYGTYLWYRKATKGWLRVDGIKLHSVTALKLTYSQAGGSLKTEYSVDGGASWTELGSTTGASELNEYKFTLSESAETISLRFTESDGTAHARIDNLKLVELL